MVGATSPSSLPARSGISARSRLTAGNVVNRLIGDVHLRSRFASRARERALELCPEQTAASYYNAYQHWSWGFDGPAVTPRASRRVPDPARKEVVKCAS